VRRRAALRRIRARNITSVTVKTEEINHKKLAQTSSDKNLRTRLQIFKNRSPNSNFENAGTVGEQKFCAKTKFASL